HLACVTSRSGRHHTLHRTYHVGLATASEQRCRIRAWRIKSESKRCENNGLSDEELSADCSRQHTGITLFGGVMKVAEAIIGPPVHAFRFVGKLFRFHIRILRREFPRDCRRDLRPESRGHVPCRLTKRVFVNLNSRMLACWIIAWSWAVRFSLCQGAKRGE